MQISLSNEAHVKMQLHSAKYSLFMTLGLLIGKASADKMSVSDVIALSHSNFPDQMSLEIALEQVCNHQLLNDYSQHYFANKTI